MRHALFSSARKDLKDSAKYYGNGVLRAANALNVPPKLDTQKLPADEARFPIWTLLLGSREDSAERQMLEVELLRLEHNSKRLQQIFTAIKDAQQATAEQRAAIVETIEAIPYASQAVRNLVVNY